MKILDWSGENVHSKKGEVLWKDWKALPEKQGIVTEGKKPDPLDLQKNMEMGYKN